MTLGDFVFIALSVAGGIALGEAAKLLIAPLFDWLARRNIETHRYALELRKLGYARILDRYLACLAILAEVKADATALRELIALTPWDMIEDRIKADDRYAPLFFHDDTRSQLDQVLNDSAHRLPAAVIDSAIAYRSARMKLDSRIAAIIAPDFKTYDETRKLSLIQAARTYAEEQLKLAPRFRADLEGTCRDLAQALDIEHDDQTAEE